MNFHVIVVQTISKNRQIAFGLSWHHIRSERHAGKIPPHTNYAQFLSDDLTLHGIYYFQQPIRHLLDHCLRTFYGERVLVSLCGMIVM